MNIQHALGDRFCMFLHLAFPAGDLVPVQTLSSSIDFVNRTLDTRGRQLQNWNTGEQDEIARLMWVNWISQRLPIEPIRKPILVHCAGDSLVVDCGDTRLMALTSTVPNATVAVLVSCSKNLAHKFSQSWLQIKSNQDLFTALQFDAVASTVCYRMCAEGSDHAIDWLEIGDQSTSHHLHDVSQRTNMMQHFLNKQPADFEFDCTWPKWKVDWNALHHAV
jgi:hypothetical protein